ncbi:MAG: hypothetical protein KME25_07980 [Symplocastrum torsivum CPER-KK1]|uniref:Uncharacterized protein n=1 Tax=Symplocastrum torsivum CPER-KK1 TaxID=450513 RepID=A0A951U904_9CYAN|nr:hypothetical protein [Symplocastrum torsivum CPER-KK1]
MRSKQLECRLGSRFLVAGLLAAGLLILAVYRLNLECVHRSATNGEQC